MISQYIANLPYYMLNKDVAPMRLGHKVKQMY